MSALVVGTTLVLASVVCFFVMRGELRGQIDDSLRDQGDQTARIPPNPANLRDFPRRVPQPQRRTGTAQSYVQFVNADGVVRRPFRPADPRLPVTVQTRELARSKTGRRVLEDAHADGVHVRMLTVALPGRGAVQLARSLASVDRALSRLRIVLALLTVFGTAFAALLARVFSQARRRADRARAGRLPGRAGRLDRRPAPARRRRLARAAHTGDERAHQRRDAARRAHDRPTTIDA